jgi:hypothetical protein
MPDVRTKPLSASPSAYELMAHVEAIAKLRGVNGEIEVTTFCAGFLSGMLASVLPFLPPEVVDQLLDRRRSRIRAAPGKKWPST